MGKHLTLAYVHACPRLVGPNVELGEGLARSLVVGQAILMGIDVQHVDTGVLTERQSGPQCA
jgi:hypothetical protein